MLPLYSDLCEKLKKSENIKEYLKLLNEIKQYNVSIILSVCDTPGSKMPIDVLDTVKELGFKSFTNELWRMYIGINIADKEIIDKTAGQIDEKLYLEKNVSGNHIEIKSEAWRNGNISVIRVNGVDYSTNMRGINIVVLSLDENNIIDSIAYDSHEIPERFTRNKWLEQRNKHYDIGMLGWWYGENYGSMLTYFALHQTLKSMGYTILMLHEATGYQKGRVRWSNNIAPMRFAQAHYDFTQQVDYREMKRYNDVCDMFLVGSDQLWNPDIGRVNDDCFFDFASENKKLISYSTSFGNKDTRRFKGDFLIRNRKNLQRFNAISVREDYAVDIAENIFGVKAVQVIDPVFLPDITEYLSAAENATVKPEGRYLLAFILDPNENKKRRILEIAEKLALETIYYLTDPYKQRIEQAKAIFNAPNMYQIEEISPMNFLYAYKNAAYIVTDSFHGTCFSYIFHKNFNVFYNNKRGSDRFISLMQIMHLENRRIYEDGQAETDLSEVDFSLAENNIRIQKERSIAWLKNVLETPIEKMPSILLPDKAITAHLNKDFCMGCSACVNICPTNALELKQDELGYYRAVINYDLCVNCGNCKDVCPSYKLPEKNNMVNPKCFEFITADTGLLQKSSSGGVFGMLAEVVLQQQGAVVGAAWKCDFSVEHIIIEDIKELYRLQKSKYLQSYIGNILKEVKKKLENGQIVLFSGCPCQIAGLLSYLGKNYKNLVTVDLLCGNAPSTMFFQKYLQEEFPQGLKSYEFRHKVQGWNADCVTVTVTDGSSEVRRGGAQDNYQRVYHNHVMCAPHCEQCKFQSLPRYGDITIGDFWGISKKDPTVDTKGGVSAVLINSEKGAEFFDSIDKNRIKVKKEVPVEWLAGNGFVNGNSNWCSPKRNDFYKAIKTMSFLEASDYALKPGRGEDKMFFPDKVNYLNYSSTRLRFKYDSAFWDEKRLWGYQTLMVKPGEAKVGRYACLSLYSVLGKGKKYRLYFRFKINTESDFLNLHIKDSGTNFHQLIYSYKVQHTDQWQTVDIEFRPKSNIYDEFMIGASQLTGKGNYLCIDCIHIMEC